MFITTDTEFDKTNLAKEIWKSANMIRVGVVVAHWRSQGGLGVKLLTVGIVSNICNCIHWQVLVLRVHAWFLIVIRSRFLVSSSSNSGRGQRVTSLRRFSRTPPADGISPLGQPWALTTLLQHFTVATDRVFLQGIGFEKYIGFYVLRGITITGNSPRFNVSSSRWQLLA